MFLPLPPPPEHGVSHTGYQRPWTARRATIISDISYTIYLAVYTTSVAEGRSASQHISGRPCHTVYSMSRTRGGRALWCVALTMLHRTRSPHCCSGCRGGQHTVLCTLYITRHFCCTATKSYKAIFMPKLRNYYHTNGLP